MLMENGGIEITRVQLFCTDPDIYSYLPAFFICKCGQRLQYSERYKIPVLLVLSGISQAGFIAGKVAMPKATETDAQISD